MRVLFDIYDTIYCVLMEEMYDLFLTRHATVNDTLLLSVMHVKAS